MGSGCLLFGFSTYESLVLSYYVVFSGDELKSNL